MVQIRPRIELSEDAMHKIENKAKSRNQKIHQYISDLLNGRISERDYRRADNERVYECHIFIPESLHAKIVEGARENGMTQKDYIVRLLETKGKPIRITYDNRDIINLIKYLEDIRDYLSLIAQTVEETNEISEKALKNTITKTEEVLQYMISNTIVERKNRKKLVKIAKDLIEGVI